MLDALNNSMFERVNGLTSNINNGMQDISNDALVIDQRVSIDARFEGRTESHQIEEALMNLVNYASQHAYDRRRKV
jgi:hypothetical protein